MAGLERSIRVIDRKGRLMAEMGSIMKDITVEEFKKLLVAYTPFGKYSRTILHELYFKLSTT